MNMLTLAFVHPVCSVRHHVNLCCPPAHSTCETSLSRRHFLRLVSLPLLLFNADSVESATDVDAATAADADFTIHANHSSKAFDLDEVAIARVLKSHCSEYLQAISPITETTILYRGTETPESNDKLILTSPQSDLFDAQTYSDQENVNKGKNAAQFFQALDSCLAPLTSFDSHIPRPRFSHIATSSVSLAAAWGTPVSVWPTGSFRCAVWNQSSLIYDSSYQHETLAATLLRKGPLLFDNHSLRRALLDGHEVMFQSSAFYTLPLHLLPPVIQQLQQE